MTIPAKRPSIWMYKPWWCQPWSIMLTSIVLLSGSWLLTKTVWVVVIVAIPVLAWMGFFLLLYPRLILESGVLDELEARSDRS